MLDADIWGFSVPRMLGIEGRLGGAEGKIHPHVVDVANRLDPDGEPGSLHVVSMGFLVDDEGTALMWRGLILTKALEQFLTDVRWGELDYLLIDMPPGTGDIQMGLARMLPQAEMLVVTTPGLAAQLVAVRVADMARRSYMKIAGVVENMSAFVAPDGEEFAIFGTGGGATLAQEIEAPLVAQIPIEPAVSHGGDTGSPVAISAPDSAAGAAFHTLAERVVTDLLPPIEMAGCTARMLELIEQAAAKSRAESPPPRWNVEPQGVRLSVPTERRTGRSGGRPGPARGAAGDLALCLEAQEVGVHLPSCGFDELGRKLLRAVEGRDDLRDLRVTLLLHEPQDLLLALAAVRDVLVDAGSRLFDDVAVTRRDSADPELAEPLERLQVRGHVTPALGIHHRPRAVEHGVTREQHALLLEEEAEVVRGMTRRVQDLEAELRPLERVAFIDHSIRDDVAVLVAVLPERNDLRAGRLHQTARWPARDPDACA